MTDTHPAPQVYRSKHKLPWLALLFGALGVALVERAGVPHGRDVLLVETVFVVLKVASLCARKGGGQRAVERGEETSPREGSRGAGSRPARRDADKRRRR